VERDDPSHVHEVLVCGQQSQLVMQAQLSDERVNSAHLHSIAAALVAQLRSPNVIFAGRDQHGQMPKALDNCLARLGPAEALQQLLQHEPGR